MKTPKSHDELTHSDGKSQALAISFSMLLLLAISAASLSLWNVTESSHDAIAINLSGRQRMLTQRIEKDLLKLNYAKRTHSDTAIILKDLSLSYTLFDQTLTRLNQGNLTDINGNAFRVTSTQSSNAIALMQQANTIWRPIQDALLPVISNTTHPSSEALEQALSSVMRGNQRLLSLMDRLTTEIEYAAHKKSHQLRVVETVAICLILVNFGFILFYFRRQLTLLSESELLSMRIMENVGTAIVVINAEGDIKLCNHAAESMFGYSDGTLAGKYITALLDKPFFLQIGKRFNGERFALDIDLSEIHASGRRLFIASLYDLTEQKFREEHLSHLAYHDPLTGLPNRLLFMDRLAQTIARAHRTNELAAVLFIDLDRFKQVNDALGHAAGDLLLQIVSTRLVSCLREGDTITRLGGDEFAMIVDANDSNNYAVVAQKILTALSNEYCLNGYTVEISGSVGASLYPNDSDDIQTLLHYADIAMYRAKAQGGNTYCKYSEIPLALEIARN